MSSTEKWDETMLFVERSADDEICTDDERSKMTRSIPAADTQSFEMRFGSRVAQRLAGAQITKQDLKKSKVNKRRHHIYLCEALYIPVATYVHTKKVSPMTTRHLGLLGY